MDNETRYQEFILALIKKTKLEELPWEYLADDPDQAIEFKEYLNDRWPNNFDTDQSFYFFQDNSYVVLLVYRDLNRYVIALYVIPSTYRQSMKILGDEYTANLTRLLENVKRCFPNPEDFIDEFLES